MPQLQKITGISTATTGILKSPLAVTNNIPMLPNVPTYVAPVYGANVLFTSNTTPSTATKTTDTKVTNTTPTTATTLPSVTITADPTSEKITEQSNKVAEFVEKNRIIIIVALAGLGFIIYKKVKK